jgi:chaperonin GroEL
MFGYEPADLDRATEDYRVARVIVTRTVTGLAARLTEPLRWIAENGGINGYVVTTEVRELGVGNGCNAATEEYGDLVAQGVLDPVEVTRSALVNATSIAAMLLTTETLIVEKPAEEEPAAGGGHGHGH